MQAARANLRKICDEVSEYGLTTAEVIKVVLRPVLEAYRGCDCWKCKSRRGDLNEEQILDSTLPISFRTLPGLDGSAVNMSSQPTDVMRRQTDGTWLCVIDNRFGGG